MTYRLHSFFAGLLALLTAALLALGAAQANPASGGYQDFEPVALEHQQYIQLSSLGNFDYFAKIASECCNATNRGVDPGTVYQVRFDPAHPGRPDPAFSVDTSTFTSGATTANGGIRNSRQFWNSWSNKSNNGLSQANQTAVANGRAPVVDDDWLRVFPEHADFRGQQIVHHHMDYGQYAIPVPRGAHNNSPGFSIWHPPRGAE